ncbi:hypothetical protein BIV60_20305 [Bacillus sp. MUM 116]|uniref:hypothetical protein n=1 Tax=Bacillus sp. MUM 116 TaxID=1678002 RepID=UPI00091952AF|nr:hypothetical protein [Bacillus sp. MUM 116]OIK10813.1 hypothetical protein BIV60_20305 [Bacillus sp. MUM 116]
MFAVNTRLRKNPFIGFIFKISGEKLETSSDIEAAIKKEHLLLVTGHDDAMIPCEEILNFHKIVKNTDLYLDNLSF